ncbi:MAG TPA: hypothetical protein VG737_02075, partial [Cyclobacteriaceae bacterium]|nr:hypothetical protein [Cyclobacteriaceae bacterium]
MVFSIPVSVFTLKKTGNKHRIHQSILEGGMEYKRFAAMKNPKKILVIDDDKDFGIALKFFFADKDVELHVAHTLSEGM